MPIAAIPTSSAQLLGDGWAAVDDRGNAHFGAAQETGCAPVWPQAILAIALWWDRRMRNKFFVLLVLLAGGAAGPVLFAVPATGAAAAFQPWKLAQAAPGNRHSQATPIASKTGKERLTDKASDEQRLDDCKVAEARRTKNRPANCRGER
jgi:hypothetical protein